MNHHKYKSLFIIGAAKAGTTYLYDNLINHPKIIGADGKNLRKIKKEPKILLEKNVNRDRYISFFKNNINNNPEGDILIDATPAYTSWPTHFVLASDIERIANEYLSVYILRDPIDRFESYINFMKTRRFILKSNLKQILDFPGGKHALTTGNYAMQLFGYKEMFEKGKLLIIDFNDLINNPKKILKMICAKLAIEFDDLPEVNLNKISNKTSSYKIDNPIFLDRFPFLRKTVHNLIPQIKRRRKITETYHKLTKSRGYPKRFLSDTEKFKLAQLYKPSLIQLKDQFGINYFETSWTTIKKYL